MQVATKLRPLSILTALLIFFACGTAFAQSGKIAGRVTDGTTGDPLPFVNVIILGTSQGAATDIDGYYSILNVRPGTYSVRASAIGYNAVTIQELQVSIDLTTQADFQLYETSLELGEEVVVIAQKPLVTKDLTASTALVDADEISALPVTEFQEVLELQAGVVGRDNNVRGGRSGEVVYAIDGVPVTDVYDGSTVVDVNASAIQELQFISGAFNAEYGRALSAYVNLATKEGSNKFTGSVTSYIGDFVSNNTEIFREIDDINPTAIRNIDGNISGPIIKDVLSFYANARYIYFTGHQKGERVYNPWDITINQGPDLPPEDRYLIQQTGDGEIIDMNFNEKVYMQGKLTFKPFTSVKLNYTYIYDRVRYRDFNRDFTLNPEGDFKRFRNGITNIFSLTHTLGSNTFYQASGSYFFKSYKQYVHEGIDNPLWVHSSLLDQQPTESPSFKTGGQQNQQFKRLTDSYGFKFDITSQVSRSHQVKAGFEINRNQVFFEDIYLLEYKDMNGNGRFDQGEDGFPLPRDSGDPFVDMRVPDPNDPAENLSINIYERTPIEFSAYLQDKIELDELIINVGLRFDYFEPDGFILNDKRDPDIYRPRLTENLNNTIEERREYWYKDAESKFQVSPRLGVAFPITDKGVIHFSYGHFFQIPNYQLLYQNPEYKFNYGTDNLGVAGNPDLKPEQTISGEIGLQQAVTDDITVDITGYFRDIKDLTGTRADEITLYGGGATYSQFTNSDFGFVKGIVLSVNKRFSNGWSASVDYTLQSAKGNASDPEATRQQLVDGEQPEIQLIPLNWDQTHTVNMTFSYSSPDDWGFSLIGQYGSGFPYTPTQSINISELLNNSELKPATFNVDLRAYYDLMLFEDYRLSFFTRVYNLFDIENELDVYQDSGTADFTINEYNDRLRGASEIVNPLDEWYRNPSYYSEPRRIEVGASFYF